MGYERTELTPRTHLLLMSAWPRMTDAQRDRFAIIAQSWRELKAELQELHFDFRAEDVEPVFASPRSSLNPRFITAAHEVPDE